MQERDFSNLKTVPGTVGNPFDLILHRLEAIQKLPGILFAFLLLMIAWLPHTGQALVALTLASFFMLDWLFLSLLPRFNRSFGPPKPPVLLLALLRTPFAFLPMSFAFPLQFLGVVLVVYAFWIEPFKIKVTRQSFSSPKLSPSTSIRLLHLGDLHIERITQREIQLNRVIAQLKPDLILFSGDILNLSYLTDPLAHQSARHIIGQWQAPLGVFAVSGSPAVDLPEILPGLLHDLPLTWLQNSKINIKSNGDEIDLIGISCTHRPQEDGVFLASLSSPGSDHLQILLYHSPDLAPIASKHGVDLQLSGHTHGGQVRLPLLGALFTGSLYGKVFEAGRYQLDNLVLYITRGLGLEGAAAPRVRFLCPPEIILWELKKE